ncbi:orotidine-5'-phosphate decarboxylase [Heyndrickxia ginsengihumi]|uniref:Orotidine 5'-phosphate decarboxylase n=1 Tax=Heyndrickxia ginsengihumi TaxID=363870 RepID=A0A0A6VHT9_9BACI|nr:orotidine-5'-phosphate decarboxylase [Heyndrickxia ginsengihumi]KHD86194.1 orotidine 5'-phosphate decarboxylase [Heyndrickxia ginsengihumi]MBE6183449.1 orotidine-5'-phosphate decarboxylase [Bacillus sp. (in: firmicutes)]MCM3022432.1 orotidine-5'-phosphate decarboxylase [Heyndrickxia ginsengihumi]NEY18627.1 orotidine-5'-phosphate decarboxylase [Heyndrickxia ginsengihumi]
MFKPIIALDFSSWPEAKRFLSLFDSESLYVKVGMELFYQTGPKVIEELKEMGHDIFLDLKLHDIPNTVHKAMKGLAQLDVNMVNVHAAGGLEMMEAAVSGLNEGTKQGKERPLIIAVTQLTSTSEEQMQKEQGIKGSLKDSVLRYAALAHQAGLDGVVCSALEACEIRNHIGSQFLSITPGIRFAGDELSDQKRVVTPALAKEYGSSAIVVGRSITKAADPYQAYRKMKQLWEA